jgi:predicted fused transcriptional regulator/phosphomethylpyrimidine kinase
MQLVVEAARAVSNIKFHEEQAELAEKNIETWTLRKSMNEADIAVNKATIESIVAKIREGN